MIGFLLIVYLIITVVVAFMLTVNWSVDRDIGPYRTPEARARDDHQFAVNVLRAPLWPWTALVLAHRAVRWLAITATRRVDDDPDAMLDEVEALHGRAKGLLMRVEEMQAITELAASRRKQGAVRVKVEESKTGFGDGNGH